MQNAAIFPVIIGKTIPLAVNIADNVNFFICFSILFSPSFIILTNQQIFLLQPAIRCGFPLPVHSN